MEENAGRSITEQRFWIATNGGALHPAGGSFKLPFSGSFYVGLVVCAHDDSTAEQAVFSKVEVKPLPPLGADAKGEVQSTLEYLPIASADRTVIYHTSLNIQAPNWTKDNHVKPGDHPPNKDVALRMMPANGGAITTLAKFFGGQGTINVASWSPDSKNIAFVTYTTIYPANRN